MSRAGVAVAAVAAGAAALASCGDGARGDAPLTVAAAASLREPLSRCADAARLTFGGSDLLAARIRQGARVDVLAAADMAVPERLATEGLLERPRVFAGNRLVIAVRARERRVRRLADLDAPGVRFAAGSSRVPVGRYARTALERAGVRARPASEEPDVAGVVAKVLQRSADAGLVYATDVSAARGRLRALLVPSPLVPPIRYGAGVVRGSEQPDRARAFVASLTAGRCQDALAAAGFLPPP